MFQEHKVPISETDIKPIPPKPFDDASHAQLSRKDQGDSRIITVFGNERQTIMAINSHI